jgi:hypothetical protein
MAWTSFGYLGSQIYSAHAISGILSCGEPLMAIKKAAALMDSQEKMPQGLLKT